MLEKGSSLGKRAVGWMKGICCFPSCVEWDSLIFKMDSTKSSGAARRAGGVVPGKVSSATLSHGYLST
jgi:hypothetical protein